METLVWMHHRIKFVVAHNILLKASVSETTRGQDTMNASRKATIVLVITLGRYDKQLHFTRGVLTRTSKTCQRPLFMEQEFPRQSYSNFQVSLV